MIRTVLDTKAASSKASPRDRRRRPGPTSSPPRGGSAGSTASPRSRRGTSPPRSACGPRASTRASPRRTRSTTRRSPRAGRSSPRSWPGTPSHPAPGRRSGTRCATSSPSAPRTPSATSCSFQRTIPGFEPSEASYRLAVAHLERLRQSLEAVGVGRPSARRPPDGDAHRPDGRPSGRPPPPVSAAPSCSPAAGRRRTPALVSRLVRFPVTVPDTTETWRLGYLVDVLLTRDAWLHRVDLCRAVGADVDLTAGHDGRIVADVVGEWARRHRAGYDLVLTGPGGGALSGGGAPSVSGSTPSSSAGSSRGGRPAPACSRSRSPSEPSAERAPRARPPAGHEARAGRSVSAPPAGGRCPSPGSAPAVRPARASSHTVSPSSPTTEGTATPTRKAFA